MKLSEAIENIKIIIVPDNIEAAVKIAGKFKSINPQIAIKSKGNGSEFKINISPISDLNIDLHSETGKPGRYVYFNIDENGAGVVAASHQHHLYSFVCYIFDNYLNSDIEEFAGGRLIIPSFDWQRITYDYFLTQEGRIQKGFDRQTYIEEAARLGFTHIEINGLAFPKALESGAIGETYPMFYTYCPALDQFVSSHLNIGLYPEEYLRANLANLKENARIARGFGLSPGLLCFEPRSVPEKFFDKYPMLRGARIDHPFRSFKPRYTMTLTHPKVREHYSEMLTKIMEEVPELSYMSIWTNDSGAGFEHTKSLYVGRNGGAYLIREWKDDEEIAKLAGENALRFFKSLRDAGAKINPDFRIITRMESFYGEHDVILGGLEKNVEVEAGSLIQRGWDMPYTHPRYTDAKELNAGTVYHQGFDKGENDEIDRLREKGSNAHFYFSSGPHSMFEPLLGIPYPRLTWQRLLTLHKNNIEHIAHTGGTFPPELVPYNINHEITRAFQFNPNLDIDGHIDMLAKKWVKSKSDKLVEAWRLAEEAILGFPNLTPLYSTFGFTWYRLWARPFVPNIEAIPQRDRDYYEKYMCTTPHNPNNVDLSRDVLFKVLTFDKCKIDIERIDNNVWGPLDKAIGILESAAGVADIELSKDNPIRDQYIRLRALRCWFMTQRNVAAWVVGVYGYMGANCIDSKEKESKENYRKFLKDSIVKEILNSRKLIRLLNSPVEFIAMADQGETELMYGTNLKENIYRRIELMQKHIDDEPFIDHNYMEREAGKMIDDGHE